MILDLLLSLPLDRGEVGRLPIEDLKLILQTHFLRRGMPSHWLIFPSFDGFRAD